MSEDQSKPPIAKLVRQHAHTARLMGVDFVPTYRMTEPAEASAPAKVVSEQQAASVDAPVARLKSVALASPSIDTPVVTTRPQAAEALLDKQPHAEPAPKVSKGASAAIAAFSFLPPAKKSGEDERTYRERALLALRERYVADAPHQHFVTAFTNLVFGDGDPCADICFVGEAPGEEEDKTGKPFVGRAGQLLNKMIVAMGLSRERVYICNVLKTRPPNNATPTTREIDLCRPYLLAQLAIVKPQAIVTLGLPASCACLMTEQTMARLRGNWAMMKLANDLEVPVMPTYHPAYLLRSYTEDNRRKVWSDLCMVLAKVGLKLPAKVQPEQSKPDDATRDAAQSAEDA